MKKLLIVFLILPFFLASCSLPPLEENESRMQRVAHYTTEHMELLTQCAVEAYDACMNLLNAKVIIIQIRDSKMGVMYHISDNTIKTFQSDSLQTLFEDGIFKQVHVDHGQIDFIYYSGGLASSSTYIMVSYLPSGRISDSRYYDDRMTFTQENGCFEGTLPEDDNRFFYCQLSDQMFYCEVSY